MSVFRPGGMDNTLGQLTLNGGSGILIEDSVNSEGAGGAFANSPFVLNADMESLGIGVLTVASGRSVTTTFGDIVVTAFDLDLVGSVNSVGTGSSPAPMSIHGSKVSQTFGFGHVAKDMHLDNVELAHLIGQHVDFGYQGDIHLNNATAGGVAYISGMWSLVANADDATGAY